MASGAWTDDKATSVLTFAVVLAVVSCVAAPMFGWAAMMETRQLSFLPHFAQALLGLLLAPLIGLPPFVLARLAASRARSLGHADTPRYTIARRLSVVTAVVSVLTALPGLASP